MVRGHEADVRQVAVALGVVHAIADDKEVGDGESDIIGVDLFEAAGGLVKQGSDAERFWMLLEKQLAQVAEGEAGIENVFDDENVFALDGLVEIFDQLDCAGGAIAFAVAGGGDEIKGRVDLDGPGEIGKEGRGALEHADHDELFAVQVLGDLGAHFGDPVSNLLTGVEDLKAFIRDGSHADSIARNREGLATRIVQIRDVSNVCLKLGGGLARSCCCGWRVYT